MENATKALYIAGGMLLGVMILSALVYVFRSGASLGQSYEADKLTQQITAFNSQFDKYVGVTIQSNRTNYGYAFEQKGNIPSDVVTCANLAYNINKKNDYDNVNKVSVIVVVGSKKFYIHPLEMQPKNHFLIDIDEAHAKSMTSVDTSNNSICKNFYDFLQQFNEVKIVNITSDNYNSSGETIYKYYFDVNNDENGNQGQGIHYSDITGKIDKIVFTAVETKKYDSLGDGCWSENL